MAEYSVTHSDGRVTKLKAKRWSIMHHNEPGEREEIPPSPAAYLYNGSVALFDPRVVVANSDGVVEYDGAALYAGVGDRILRRRFSPEEKPRD